MGVRELAPDETFTPIAPRGRVRALAPDEPVTPLHPSALPEYTPTLTDKLFGRSSPTNENVEGIVPAIGRASPTNENVEGVVPAMAHAGVTTLGNWAAGIMRGGAAASDFMMDVGKYAFPSDASEETTRAADQIQEEQRRSAQEFWTPKETTPAGEVGGGLAEIALPLALGGGTPAVLVGSEADRKLKDLEAQGVDPGTAEKIAAIHGGATLVGSMLPIAGRGLVSRLTTGALGNVALGEVEREKTQDTLAKAGYEEAAAQHNFSGKEAAIAALIGAAFGGLHHANAGPENVARARAPDEGIEGELIPGGARRGPSGGAGATIDSGGIPDELPALPPPPPRVPPQLPPKIPERGMSPIEQETHLANMGLTPDVIGNLIKLEDKAETARAGRVLPPPDETLYVGPEGEARTLPQIEGPQRAEQQARDLAALEAEKTAKAKAASDVELGLTPDVRANLARLEERRAPIGDVVAPKEAAAAPVETPVATGAKPTGRIRELKPEETVTPLSRPSIDHGILSPSGKASKPSRDAALERNRVALFGKEGLKRPETAQPTEAEALRRQAAELRDLADRGMGPKKNAAEAARLEAKAGALERNVPEAAGSRGSARPETAPKTAKPKSVLEHLASKGGLSIDALEKEGIDRADMQGVRGFKRPFTKKGMSLDAGAESLAEAGYPVVDEAGRPDANKALDLIDRELKGQRTHPRGAEEPATSQDVERRRGEHRIPERSAPPAEGERRAGGERRKPVSQMSAEEMRGALLTSDKTGLPNRRAYEDAGLDQKPHQASIDVDSFKWFNDTFSHDDGDKILEALGQAMKSTGHDVHHMSGDEFALAGDTREEIDAAMEDLREAASRLQFTFENADGERWTVDGLGLSYGVGKDLKSADVELQRDKAERTARGERPARGEQPQGAAREGSTVQEGEHPTYRREAPAESDVDERTAEHVTLKGEGFLSHKGPVEHVDIEGDQTEPHGVEEQKPKQGDLFTKDDARPNATERQIALANQLLKELKDAAASDVEQDIKSLAVAFNKDFRTDHTASLVGLAIRSAQDLATLGEIYRNKRFETLRYFMTDKSGRVVAQTGVSSRLPASAASFPTGKDFDWVRKFTERGGEGGNLWLLHNHPSGSALPSTADTAMTSNMAKSLGREITHVVVNHDHYGRMLVDKDGTVLTSDRVPLLEKTGQEDKLAKPSKPHALLGRSIIGPNTLVELAKELEKKDGYITVVGTAGSAMKVRTLGDMPAHLMSNPERLKQQLRRYAVQNGNQRLFLVGVDPAMFRSGEGRKLLDELQYDGFLLDVVTRDGHSYTESGGGHRAGGSTLFVSGKEFGLHGHDVATEEKTRNELEADQEAEARRTKQREEHQRDLLGDEGAANRNKLARLESAKSAKRSPNKDVSADTGKPGDLFTKAKQAELINEETKQLYGKDVLDVLERGDVEEAKKNLDSQIRALDNEITELGKRFADDPDAFNEHQVDSAMADLATLHDRYYDMFGEPHPTQVDRVGETPSRYGDERRAGEERRRLERGGRREGDEDKSQKGDKGYAAVAQNAIDAWNKKIGWRYGPLGRLPAKKEYLEERYRALGKVTESQELARNVYESLKDATPADAAAAYEYMTNKDGDPSKIGDVDNRRAAIRAKKMIDEIGQRLVDAGLLSKEAYEAHAGEYLPRLYLKHVLGEGVMSAIGSGKRMSDLGYLKQRQEIPEEVRKLILGEITDPAFLASFGISRTMRDLALHDFLRAIAGREQWVPKHSTVEWRGRQVTPFYLADEARELRKRAQLYKDPKAKAAALKLADEAQAIADEGLAKLEARPDPNDFEQIPNSKRYGALRGMYVRKEIYGDLVGAQQWVPPHSSVAETLLGQGGLAARAQSWWKTSKVILNPPTQVRNFVANMSLLHLSGVPFHRVYSGEIIGKAINSIANKDRFYQIAKKYGVRSATYAATEGGRIREEWLALQDMKGGGLPKLKAFAGRAINAASDFYQLMEAISKIAKIRDAIEREGKSPADAALEAHEALFDYSLVPRSVQYLRNAPVGAPFITFAYKAAAQMAKIAVKHPARFAPYVAIPFLLAELIKNSYDVNDDDLEKLRNALPQWMKQRGHMLLLPYKDAEGRWQVVDMGYLAPWGQFADLYAAAKEGGGAKELAGSLVFSGPMMDVASAVQTNVDPFTGKPIVDPRDPPADRLQAMMQYVWNLAAPGWWTERGAINQIRHAMSGTNVNKKTGEPGMTPTQASLRLLGLNVYPADPAATRAANLRSMKANLEESRARAAELVRNKNLSQVERDRISAVWNKLLEARGKEIELYSRESEINPKLE